MKLIPILALFISLLIGLTFLLRNESVLLKLIDFLDYIRDSGFIGWLVLVFLSVSMNLLAIPMSLFDLSVGYIYPIPYAFLTLILVRFLSAAGSFVIAKYMCAECAKNTFIKKKEVKSDSQSKPQLSIFQKFQILVIYSPWKGGLLVSLAWIPISVKMYGLTLAGMPFVKYISVIMAGSLPFTISQVFYGSKMKKIMDVFSGRQQPGSLIEVLPGFIAVVALVMLVWTLTGNIDKLVQEGKARQKAI